MFHRLEEVLHGLGAARIPAAGGVFPYEPPTSKPGAGERDLASPRPKRPDFLSLSSKFLPQVKAAASGLELGKPAAFLL
jgi:hypothetical protein